MKSRPTGIKMAKVDQQPMSREICIWSVKDNAWDLWCLQANMLSQERGHAASLFLVVEPLSFNTARNLLP